MSSVSISHYLQFSLSFSICMSLSLSHTPFASVFLSLSVNLSKCDIRSLSAIIEFDMHFTKPNRMCCALLRWVYIFFVILFLSLSVLVWLYQTQYDKWSIYFCSCLFHSVSSWDCCYFNFIYFLCVFAKHSVIGVQLENQLISQFTLLNPFFVRIKLCFFLSYKKKII